MRTTVFSFCSSVLSRTCPKRPRWARLLLLGALLGSAAKPVTAQDLHGSEQDLLQGRIDQVVRELGANPSTAAAHLLLCRAYLAELHGSEAARECRTALQAGLSQDASAQDWAGRAFGMEAEHAGPISGLKLAGQVRNAFSSAHALNARNPAAANDLGEYYINAPSLVGGGVEKALALADAIASSLPEIAHRLRALVAEKRGDSSQAEREFLAATQIAASPGAYADLGTFYARQHADEKAAAAARRAIAIDRAVDANVVDAAGTLTDVHQPAQALAVLRRYLDHGQHSDQAPLSRVHTMIGDILAGQGDKAGARQEFQAALALASDYRPARKGLDTL